ncbi:MAG: ComEC/Rec2 family competence protein [Nitriliruptoraceae bacterium]
MSADPRGDAGAHQAEDVGEPSTAPARRAVGPLGPWAVAAVVGALAGEHLAASGIAVGHPIVGAATVTVCLVGAAVRRRPRLAGLVGLVAVLLVTAGAAGVREHVRTSGELVARAERGGSVVADATVVREPRRTAMGWHTVLRVDEVDGSPVGERAAATLDGPVSLGTVVRVEGTLRPVPEDGYGRWVARQHVRALLDVTDFEITGEGGVLSRASEHVRDRVRRAAVRHGDVGGLLVGFVTGDTRLLTDETAEAMRATGLTHLTAVSGSNVAILLGGVLALVYALGVGVGPRRAIVVLTIVWFAFVTRLEPSVLRAGTMALLLVLVNVRGVARDARHALAGAVLLLVLVDPFVAGSLGLLLSATATAGVLVVAPLVRERLAGWPAIERTRVTRRLADVAAVTIGAQVAVVPLLLATFGEVPLASVPANVIAVPAAMIAAAVSFVATAVAVVHVGVASALLWVAAWPARIVIWSAYRFADTAAIVDVTRAWTVVALVTGCGWIVARPRGRVSRVLVVATVVALLMTSLPIAGGWLPRRDLTVTAIDVGQGDAFLVESPGARILVDAGGDATAARWLRSHGRRHVDVVVVTHPHLDHVGGVAEVLRRIDVGALWFRPQPTELDQVADMLVVARDRRVAVRVPRAGDAVTVGDLFVEVLYPPEGRPHEFDRSELNETSTVLRVTHADGRRILATGDVERAAQAHLLEHARDQLRAELITVPHHGAATTDPAFLATTGARAGLVSAGVDNRHGHPHPDVLAMLDDLGVEVRRTDREGTVRVAVPARVREAPASSTGVQAGLVARP